MRNKPKSFQTSEKGRANSLALGKMKRERNNQDEWSFEHTLNPNYTFESFVVGAANQLAYDAARMVSSVALSTSNLLLVHGGIGQGKTHLVQAVGNYTLAHGAKACYVPAESFFTGYITALQNNQLTEFRKQYRIFDVLVIDDIDFLKGKFRLATEFSYTVKYLLQNQTTVILSSSTIDEFSAELIFLFRQNLVFQVGALNQRNELITLIQKNAAAMKLEIELSCIKHLSRDSDGDIRKLEGLLANIAFQKSSS